MINETMAERLKKRDRRDDDPSLFITHRNKGLVEHSRAIDDIRAKRERDCIHGGDEFLELCAKEINMRMKIVGYQVVEVGKVFSEVKDELKTNPGIAFDDWCYNKCGISPSTARNFMNVFRTCWGRPEVVEKIKNKSLMYALAAPETPEDLRELIFEEGDCDRIKVQDFNAVLVKYRNGELELSSPEVKKMLRKVDYHDDAVGYVAVLLRLDNHLDRVIEEVEILDKTITVNPLLETKEQTKDPTLLAVKDFLWEVRSQVKDRMEKIMNGENVEPAPEVHGSLLRVRGRGRQLK